MSGKSDDFMAKVKQYYSNHQKPSNSGVPPFIHQNTPFTELGHPDFVPEVPNMSGGYGKIKYKPSEISDAELPAKNNRDLNGKSSDLSDANRWALKKFGDEYFEVVGGTRCKIKAPNSSYADSDGWVECVWHHHEDAKTLMPVPIQTHNRSFPTGSSHTGGAAILKNSELHDLIGFFESPEGI